ncbi:MAG: hypothetical protein JRC53_02710 [Deltaproteobacteria bacterium]|nr:hypothetical protein [Deltaproteobacteria bacterium]
MKRIKVNLDKQSSLSYEICIGHNIFDRIGLIMAKNNLAHRYIVIADSNVSALYGEKFLAVLRNMGIDVDLIEFPAGESSKNISTILTIAKNLVNLGVDRSSALIALGGGVCLPRWTAVLVVKQESIFQRVKTCWGHFFSQRWSL